MSHHISFFTDLFLSWTWRRRGGAPWSWHNRFPPDQTGGQCSQPQGHSWICKIKYCRGLVQYSLRVCMYNPGDMERNPPTAFSVINQSIPELSLVNISTVVTPRTHYTQIWFNLVKVPRHRLYSVNLFLAFELTRVYAGNWLLAFCNFNIIEIL